jgi:hypothetical protein
MKIGIPLFFLVTPSTPLKTKKTNNPCGFPTTVHQWTEAKPGV